MEDIGKLDPLKEWAAKLEQEIHDEKARDYFLRLPRLWLADVERGACPPEAAGLTLSFVEQLLGNAQRAVTNFGPNLRLVGEK